SKKQAVCTMFPLVVLLVLGCLSQEAWSCSCGIRHPQSVYCDSAIGHIVDKDVLINSCSFIAPWASMTYCQKRGFTHAYAKNCDCKIKQCSLPPCEIDDDRQCLWTDHLTRQKRAYTGHQAANLACVNNGNGLCIWDSLKSRVYSLSTKSATK
ncbi:hypothetical protein AB205_0203230, partial [Aquarana catesbeiana]